MKNKLINIIKLLVCMVVFFSIGDISKFILSIFNISVTNLNNKELVIYQFILSTVLFIIFILMYFEDYKKDYKKLKKDFKNNISYIIKMFIILLIVKELAGFLSSALIVILKYDTSLLISENQKLIEEFVKNFPILMFISSGLLGPFYEEGLFRLGIKKVINNKYLFIVLSGTIFGLMHIFPLSDGIPYLVGFIQSITYVIIGLMFAYIYQKSDNIYISTGVHLLNNLISVLIMINLY